MRISALALIVVVGCGGKAHPVETVRGPDAGPPPDLCGGYALAIKPPLQRMERAMNQFSTDLSPDPEASARAAHAFATALDAEERTLASLKTGRADIDAANGRLVESVGALAGAVHDLGDGLDAKDAVKRKTASDRMKAAFVAWQAAVQGVQAVCPSAGA